jgi:SAM-dependent methyltransferase
LNSGDPLGWFEALYAQAKGDSSIIPWADLAPNPNLLAWLTKHHTPGQDKTALVIGCGLGDDAEELARRGFATTAFDISATAIRWCHRRFPRSQVKYVVADLFAAPSDWNRKFDFVVESYTLQVLPPDLRQQAIARIASFVAPQGTLLIIARGREASDPPGEMPWPLVRQELDDFRKHGLTEVAFEDYMDHEEPPARRFRVTYTNYTGRKSAAPITPT